MLVGCIRHRLVGYATRTPIMCCAFYIVRIGQVLGITENLK